MSTHINTISDGKEIQHFSHDHPLIYTEDEDFKSLCSACGVALLSSPSYRCSQDCNFFLHQPCVQLTRSSSREFRGRTYDLKLLAEPPHENCKCQKCDKLCTMFTYECTRQYWSKTFYLHCQCAFPLEINIKHISHHEHSLASLGKEASLLCDACGREQKGTFFSCSKCCFHIHQDCCLLPTIAKINQHRHLLVLYYSLSNPYLETECLICNKDISLSFGAYVCDYCDRGAHLNCAAPELEEPEIVQAPILPGKPDTFPSLVIRRLIERGEVSEIKDGESKVEKYHSDHSHWNRESDIDQVLVCNACIQPIIISPPLSHYSCPRSQCDFLLHQICANLPPTVKEYFLNRPLNFFSESSDFSSMFTCVRCRKRCNGFGYKDNYDLCYDVECAAAPTTIKHISHSQHLLALSSQSFFIPLCCGDYRSIFFYTCRLCDYFIDLRCAFLPKTVKHKFDEHPLDLIYDPSIQIRQKEDEEEEHHYLCEFCEEDVNPEFWFYYCGKCDQSFHVNCIPSTGELSKIKFGYNIVLPRNVHDDHPVTLTRMLTMGSQRCGFCEDVIPGFIDDMAFHCSMCDFWIHFKCARKVSGFDISHITHHDDDEEDKEDKDEDEDGEDDDDDDEDEDEDDRDV